MQSVIVEDQMLRLEVDFFVVVGPFSVWRRVTVNKARDVDVHVPFALYYIVETTDCSCSSSTRLLINLQIMDPVYVCIISYAGRWDIKSQSCVQGVAKPTDGSNGGD